jgi:hypothetical protein
MDGHHVRVNASSISCGILTLSGIEADMQRVLYQVASYLYHPSRGTPAAMLIWSDLTESNGALLYGRLAEIFGTSGLSQVGPVENPHTGNDINLYSWIINHEALRSFYREERVARARKA